MMRYINVQMGDSIFIGDIRLKMLPNRRGRSNQTKIGIDAPANVKVLREELVKRDAYAEAADETGGSYNSGIL